MVLAETMLIVLTINHFPDILYSLLISGSYHFTVFVRMLADIHFSHFVIIFFIGIGVLMTFFIIDRYCLVRFSSSDPLSKTVLLPLDYFLLIEVKIIFMFAVPCFLSCFSCVCLCATLWTIAYQSPLSMGFSRQEYWSGLPCPPPGDLPNPGSYPHLLSTLHWQVCYLPLAYHGKPQVLFIIL